MFFKKMVVCITVLAIGSFTFGDLIIPDGPPSWWPETPGSPPDELTRAQMHGFTSDPNLNLPPDWTYNGYTPSVGDLWTLPGGITYGDGAAFWPVRYLSSSYLNDGVGIWLDHNDSISKLMGNQRVEEWTKNFYVLAIWHNPTGGNLHIDIESELPGDIITASETRYDDGSWHATVINGTIEPQPNWEEFTFTSMGNIFIDTIMIGTHCPEPATLCLLALGGITVLRRRH